MYSFPSVKGLKTDLSIGRGTSVEVDVDARISADVGRRKIWSGVHDKPLTIPPLVSLR